MLVPSLGMGGMERVCVNYANLLTERGYYVTLMNLTSDSPMIVEKLNKEVIYQSNISQRVPGVLKAGFKNLISGHFRIKHIEEWIRDTKPEKLYKLLITEKPDEFDIEIAFYGGHMMKIISGSNQTNSIKIGWIHSPAIETHFRLFRNTIEARSAYRSMDLLVCVSEQAKQKAQQVFGEDIIATVIHNPNNVSLIRQMSNECVDSITKTKFTFINASRLEIQVKGLDRLLKCCKRLSDEGFEYDLWILGDGEGKELICELICQYQLSSFVHYLGKQDNPYSFMNSADCYICSSRSEGFSMVVAESVILGLPVISTDISGAREMLGDSEYGLIVENSEDGIYEGMKKVLSDRTYWDHLKEQAQKRKDFLSEEKIMNEFENIITEELDRRKNA